MGSQNPSNPGSRKSTRSGSGHNLTEADYSTTPTGSITEEAHTVSLFTNSTPIEATNGVNSSQNVTSTSTTLPSVLERTTTESSSQNNVNNNTPADRNGNTTNTQDCSNSHTSCPPGKT